MSNGLCSNTQNETTYWRESCTDESWGSAFCLGELDACGSVRFSSRSLGISFHTISSPSSKKRGRNCKQKVRRDEKRIVD